MNEVIQSFLYALRMVLIFGLTLLCGYLYGRMEIGEQVREQMQADKQFCDSIALQKLEMIQVLKNKYK